MICSPSSSTSSSTSTSTSSSSSSSSIKVSVRQSLPPIKAAGLSALARLQCWALPSSCQGAALLILLLTSLAVALLPCSWAQDPSPPDDHPIPRYQRGAHPNWLAPKQARKRGLTYLGSAERLRLVMHKLKQGEKVQVTAIGGSLTVGHGAGDGMTWPVYLGNWLQDAFPDQTQMLNSGVPGTMSNYLAVCTSLHVPNNTDIVIVEYSHNDFHLSRETMDTMERRAYERLLRKLLNLPNHPAVLLMHVYSYREVRLLHHYEGYWGNAERDLSEFEKYYNLPAVSVKACCYHLMEQNVTGFRVDEIPSTSSDPLIKYKVFYGDNVHGGGHTGYRVFGELVIHLMMVVLQGLRGSPIGQEDVDAVMQPIPAPMIPGNWELVGDRCLVGANLQAAALSHEGWDWVDETRRGKWGFVSTSPGSLLQLKVDTSTQLGPPEALIQAELAILRSYEHMGQALVSCQSGCTCQSSTVDGHSADRKVSQMELHNFRVSKSPSCIISIQVLPSSSSGEFKVKVQGLFIAEEEHGSQLGTRGVMDQVVV